MFGDDFFLDVKQPKNSANSDKSACPPSPPQSCEEWLFRERIKQWPLLTSKNAEELGLKPEDVLGSLQDIEEDLLIHSHGDKVFLDDVDRRLRKLEDTLKALGSLFFYKGGVVTQKVGDPANIRDTTFLTQLLSSEQVGSTRFLKKHKTTDNYKERSVKSVVYPGISATSNCALLPFNLVPLQLLEVVTKAASFPSYILKSWCMFFYSDSSCSLLQNAFWYVWLSYFKLQPELIPTEQSRLFTLISGNFVSLLLKNVEKHKDKVFWHYQECLPQAVYSTFCHAFPASNRALNSDEFLSFITNATSEWISGVKSPPRSWTTWPFFLLDPYHTRSAITSTAVDRESIAKRTALVEKRARKPSAHHKELKGILRHRSSSKTKTTMYDMAALRTIRDAYNPKEEVESGPGPLFECIPFNLVGKSPILQHYLKTHGLTEKCYDRQERVKKTVIGRTQIKELPVPSITYEQLLRSSKASTKEKYYTLQRELKHIDQEIAATQKKHSALLRATDKHYDGLLKYRHKIAFLAEKIVSGCWITQLDLPKI